VKKHYLLAGLAVAVLAAGAVIVVGGRSPEKATGAATIPPTAPAGHASATGSPATQEAMADDSPALKKRIAKLEIALAKSPHDAKAMVDLAEAYFLAARYDEATTLYNEALAAKPDNSAATVGLALIWHAQGSDDKAIAALTAVLKSDQRDQQAHYTMAIILFSQQDIAAARSEWAKAASIDPTSQIGKASQNFVELIDGQGASAQGD
jgi:cytochrome c-type biogenesis protein CcmH/NrfG